MDVDADRVELQSVAVTDDDSGEIETLPDGSVSIPVYEEELVVTRRPVLKERVIVRRTTFTEQVTVRDEVRREVVEIDADPAIEERVDVAPGLRRSSGNERTARERRPLFDGGPLFDVGPPIETRPFAVASEFLLVLGFLAAVAYATWVADALDATQAWLLVAAVGIAYVLARGLAKTGTPAGGR